jgi:hypothetical protein
MPDPGSRPGVPCDAATLLALAQHDAEELLRTLLALAGSETGAGVLADALPEVWVEVADALRGLDDDEVGAESWRCSTFNQSAGVTAGTFAYVLLQAADHRPAIADAETIGVLATACVLDPRLLRHVLAWAAERRAWPSVVEVLQWVAKSRHPGPFSRLTNPLSTADPDVARRLSQRASAAHPRQVRDVVTSGVAEWFDEPLDLLIELGHLDLELARQGAGRPALERFAQALRPKAFDDESGYRPEGQERHRDAVRFLPLDRCPDDPGLIDGLGVVIGRVLVDTGRPRTPELVAEVLGRPELLGDAGDGRWVGLALLWAALVARVGYGYGHHAARDGVLADLDRLLEQAPDAWRETTRAIVHHHDTLGDEVVDRLLVAAVRHSGVADALRRVAATDPDTETRDVARGLVARVDGAFASGGDFSRWLADAAARAYDDAQFFPNPLTPLTTTWTGAPEVEAVLRQATRQAMADFADYVRDQGAAVEEHVVGVLLRDLERGVRSAAERVQRNLAGRIGRTLSIKHRTINKGTEEPKWGCDVALLLRVEIPGQVDLSLAELVQVKKSLAIGDGRDTTDRWAIKVDQLLTLLDRSDGAVYALILADGDVACVPAAWLRGLVAGHGGLSQGTVTVGYHEVRCAAIPMGQLLGELVLGTWLGSARADVLELAAGENPNMVPRHILEIEVRAAIDR